MEKKNGKIAKEDSNYLPTWNKTLSQARVSMTVKNVYGESKCVRGRCRCEKVNKQGSNAKRNKWRREEREQEAGITNYTQPAYLPGFLYVTRREGKGENSAHYSRNEKEKSRLAVWRRWPPV